MFWVRNRTAGYQAEWKPGNFRPAPGPTQPSVQWLPAFLSEGKVSRRDADSWPPCFSEFKNDGSFTFTFLPEWKVPLWDLGLYGRIVKWMWDRDGRVWTGFLWLQTGSSSGLFWKWLYTLGFYKGRVAERDKWLSASHEWLLLGINHA